ncbi:MAG: membrane protein insertion efficiency factor YidD [Brevinema sp.]
MKKDYSFPSTQRIKCKKEFQQLYQKSFRIYGGSFIYRWRFTESPKLGISISKKFGNAVYRNQIKRIIREEYRHYHFPYPLSLLINQSKPDQKNIRKELQRVFTLLSDYYLLQQCSVEDVALKTAQSSTVLSIPAKILFMIILGYRKYISKQLRSSCRFTPSCSIYALEAIRVYGFIKASWLITNRLLRCNPWGGSGYDPVPSKKVIEK